MVIRRFRSWTRVAEQQNDMHENQAARLTTIIVRRRHYTSVSSSLQTGRRGRFSLKVIGLAVSSGFASTAELKFILSFSAD